MRNVQRLNLASAVCTSLVLLGLSLAMSTERANNTNREDEDTLTVVFGYWHIEFPKDYFKK